MLFGFISVSPFSVSFYSFTASIMSVELISYQIFHLDEKHQLKLFQLIPESVKLLNKVLMLQYYVSVKDKEISSSKATVSCSLLEISLNHQPVVMVFLTTSVTHFMKVISVVNRRNEHSLILHNTYTYTFSETTSYCQGKSQQKSQSFWYPRKYLTMMWRIINFKYIAVQ